MNRIINVLMVLTLAGCGGSDGNITVETLFPFSDTGQTSCYDELGAVISCSGTGQDGEYSINPPSFTDNGDGTVTDNVTNYIWQQADDNNSYTWDEALTYCENLSLGNNPEAVWRLPSRRDLFSIYDFSYFDPALDSVIFPDTNLGFYWSSSINGNDLTKAGTVHSLRGFAGSNYSKTDTYNVRCVSVSDNGTVSDPKTDLMWQKSTMRNITWKESLDHCNGLFLAGYGDWRLPNIRELESLMDLATNESILEPDPSPETYWSSTTMVFDTISAWTVYFGYNTAGGSKNNLYSARCVR